MTKQHYGFNVLTLIDDEYTVYIAVDEYNIEYARSYKSIEDLRDQLKNKGLFKSCK